VARRSVLQLAWRTAQTGGVRALLSAGVQRFLFARRSWIVNECLLPGPPPEPDPDGIIYRRATAEDLAALAVLLPHHSADELREWLHDPHWRLHVGCDGGRLVAFRAAGPDPAQHLPLARVLHLEQALRLGERDIFIYETFTHPEYRNRGIGRRMSLASDDFLADDGFRREMSVMRVDNVPSLHMTFGKGTRPILHVSYVRLLFFRRCDVSRELPAEVRRILATATSGRR
jgi:GNAT superfamily N-acetyltransferase